MKAAGDDVASTKKEAEQAGQQLIKERETLAEKMMTSMSGDRRLYSYVLW